LFEGCKNTESSSLYSFIHKYKQKMFNPLSVNVVHVRHYADVACKESLKMASVFLNEEKICYKMVSYNLYLN